MAVSQQDMLNVLADPVFDNSIVKYQYHAYQPFSQSTLNNSDEIRMVVQQMDLYTLPSESFISLEGHVTFTETTTITTQSLSNNFPAFLFDEIRFELNNVDIDHTKNVGITTLMKNLCSLEQSEENGMLVSGWNRKETFDVGNQEHFNVILPLKKLLGFCEDYKKILVNVKQELVLLRSRNDLNCYVSASDQTTKIHLDKVTWWVPHVILEDVHKLKLLQVLNNTVPITMSFRTWDLYELPLVPQSNSHVWNIKTSTDLEKPRHLILAFQKNRKFNRQIDSTRFDNSNISTVKLYLNSDIYPYETLNIDWANNHSTAICYFDYSKFQSVYYGEKRDKPFLDVKDFKANYPMYVIDCSRQNESIKNSIVDIRLDFQTSSANIPANTAAYALILHDKLVKYNPMTGIVEKII